MGVLQAPGVQPLYAVLHTGDCGVDLLLRQAESRGGKDTRRGPCGYRACQQQRKYAECWQSIMLPHFALPPMDSMLSADLARCSTIAPGPGAHPGEGILEHPPDQCL